MKQRIKIMNSEPKLSDDEIRTYMDFDVLLSKQKKVQARKLRGLKWGVGLLLIGVVVTITFFQIKSSEKKKEQVLNNIDSTEYDKGKQLKNESDAVALNKVHESNHGSDKRKATQNTTVATEALQDSVTQRRKTVHNFSKENIYIQAEPLNGYANLYTYFSNNLVYPKEAIKDSIQGLITLSFVIDIDGRAKKIEIKQSLGELFDKEAIRLVANMPLWKPAMLNGNVVSSQISLPITFQIQKSKSKEVQ